MRSTIQSEQIRTETRPLRMHSHNTTRQNDMRPAGVLRRQDCPCCYKPLAARTLNGITIALCGDCGGVWLKAGQMPALLERGPLALLPLTQEVGRPMGNVEVALETGRSLRCPHCHVPMEGGPYGFHLGARVDHCSQCSGAWVGAGELATIVEHHAHERSVRQHAPRRIDF